MTDQTLSEIALDIDSMLAVVEDYLHKAVAGIKDEHSPPYFQGLCIAVEKSRDNAKYLHERIDSSGDVQKLPVQAFANLTSEQRQVVLELAEDIAQGNLDPQHVLTTKPSRVALACFQAQTTEMTAEECAAEFEKNEFDVYRDMTNHVVQGEYFTLSKKWTLKGLRDELACQRFLGSIQFESEDQSVWVDLAS